MNTLNSLSSPAMPLANAPKRTVGQPASPGSQVLSSSQSAPTQDVFFSGKHKKRAHHLLDSIKGKLGLGRAKAEEKAEIALDEPATKDAGTQTEAEVENEALSPEALPELQEPEKSLLHKQLDALIADNADLNQPTSRYGKPILHDAAFMGEQAVVLKALAHGADINNRDGQGMTALHWANRAGEDDMAGLLHRRGASHHIEDYHGNTPSGIPFDFKPERPTRSAFRD